MPARGEPRRWFVMAMKIPLIKPDLPSLDEVAVEFSEVLDSGRVTNFGKYVAAFEAEATRYLGTPAVTVSSGTAGLVFALQAVGLRKGQKVVVPSFTFMASAQAILYAGGVPTFAEVGEDLTLCPKDLAGLLEKDPDVAGVLATHAYGLPCRVDAIQQVVDAHARRRSRPVFVVYDAAHAFGSAVNGRRVAGFGDAEVFSLSVTKMLVSIEGGMVTSRSPEIVERVRRMRNYGIEANYDSHWPGMNGKMSELHAIVGLHNLRRLDGLVKTRQHKARYFLDQIRKQTDFETLPWPDGVVHTFKDFTVLVPEERIHFRDDVMGFARDRGVETRAYFYPPVHEQRLFQPYADRGLDWTEKASRRVITLPFFTAITEAEMDYVVETLRLAQERWVK
jgi:dTDP-4-amino-4,6-dideoxygalactose transaminase